MCVREHGLLCDAEGGADLTQTAALRSLRWVMGEVSPRYRLRASWGGDGPSGPRMDDSDGMGCERLFTPFETLPTALHLMSKHLTKVRDDS